MNVVSCAHFFLWAQRRQRIFFKRERGIICLKRTEKKQKSRQQNKRVETSFEKINEKKRSEQEIRKRRFRKVFKKENQGQEIGVKKGGREVEKWTTKNI